MLDFIQNKADCTGCGACFNVCPVDAIAMRPDEEGFAYPEANEHCISCGKCHDVCPLASNRTRAAPDTRQHACAVVSMDEAVWKASSSGGAFTEICRAFGDDETAIFGAAFDNMRLLHSHAIGHGRINAFRRSKYVQSDIQSCFRDVRALLEQGRHVIFSGTPCQIAGLRSYLRRSYTRLLCVDFICHGVGSPSLFHDFLGYLEVKYGSRIIDYAFRTKNVFLGNYASRYVFASRRTVSIEKDEYNQLFLQQLCLRPCCAEHCRFRTSARLSDLTMADFKGRDKLFPEISDYRNYSLLIVNSATGDAVFRILAKNVAVLPCDLRQATAFNPLFDQTGKGNPLRDAFFRDFAKGTDFDTLARTYAHPPAVTRWTHRLPRLIPYGVKTWIRRFRARQQETASAET